jgi:nucleoside-diphosphate-sugar epimerase
MAHVLEEDLDHVLEHTAGIWDAVRRKNIFLTGGTGFVGTWLVESFVWINRRLNLGAKALLLTRDPEKFKRKAPEAASDSSIEYVIGDATSFSYPRGSFPFIIHAATEQSFAPTASEPAGTFERDVAATKRVLEFARTCGTERFLLTSSGAVYGKQPSDLTNIPEDFPGAPSTIDANSAYGQAKRVSEYLSAMYARQFGFASILARLFAFAGPHLPLEINFAIGNFVRDVLNGGPIRIGGDGTPCRSYLYGSDMAIWIWTLLLKGESLRFYNVGSGGSVTIAELARAVARNTEPETKVEIAKKATERAPVQRYVPCVKRASEELGLQVWIGLDEAIRRMYEWNRQISQTL